MTAIIGTWRLAVASTKQLLRSREFFVTMVVFPSSLLLVTKLFSELKWQSAGEAVGLMELWITGMGVLGVALGNGHAFLATISTYKAGGVLKRVSVTPISPGQFILAEVVPRTLMGMITIVGFLAAGSAFGAKIQLEAGILAVLPVMVMVTATGLSIAFMIAGLTKSPQNANALDSAVSFPLYLFTGAMFPLASFPDWLEQIVNFIPYTGLIATVRGIVIYGRPLTDFGLELAIAGAWMAVIFAGAARAYRFIK